ncbi:MAG: site-specific DNA-methyltransferase, partial [Acidiferrobacterales bacterium]|nr:site-specific DNA-methyltransferase [Acidiferrobacterales bacterium]
ICVQCSHSPSNQGESPETGYLSVTMDEIFGRDNFIVNLIWKKKGNPSNTAEAIGTITESILVFAKSIGSVVLNRETFDRVYKFKENGAGYNLEQPIKTAEGEYERRTMTYDIETPEGVFSPPTGKRWTYGKRKMEEFVSKQKYAIKDGLFFIKKFEDDYKYGSTKIYKNLLQDLGSLKSAKDQLRNLGFSREEFESPKPEELMRHIIEMTTQKGDIVLDYHLGSGTTAAVAHKMGRQYIGVEQMNYIYELTATRLKKVVEGEKGGVSRAINWRGGRSFVFAELAASNSVFAERIISSQDSSALTRIYSDIQECGFLRYEVDLNEYDVDEFTDLNLHDAKRVLMACLDTNHLYINLGSLGDTDFDVSNEDARITRSFYGLEE